MEAGTTTTMTAKLPIHPGDYKLWNVGTVEQTYEPTTSEEKLDRKNEIKARATLLMALPNKDQMKLHTYQDAKLLMEAIEKRYGGNKESKKAQKTLLKQQYENFSALRSSSTSQNSRNVAFVSSNSKNSTISTNVADNTAYGVSVAHTQGNSVNSTSLENLKQIDSDDLEEMDLQWEMVMLTIKARRFYKRIGRKMNVNGQRVGFDKTEIEYYNCHKHGHFARECRAPRNQENRGRENNRTMTVKTPTENTLVAQDGLGGYDWSYQDEEEHPINFALMAYTSSGSSSSSDSEIDSCSKSSVKAYATLKEQYDSLESVEARLAHYKKNEAVFEESINVLKLEVRLRDNALDEYKIKLEKAEKERDQLNLTLEKFQSSSKINDTTARERAVVSEHKGIGANAVKASACWGNPQQKEYKEKGVIDSGCSRHMIGNKYYLTEYKDYDGVFVSFGDGKGRIYGKGKIKTGIENQLDHKVKVIRCDNGTEFRNSVMNQFCDLKGIKMEFSVARTPEQNGVAERKNRTLIEAARTISSQVQKEKEPEQKYILIPLCTTDPLISQDHKNREEDVGVKPSEVDESGASDKEEEDNQASRSKAERLNQREKQTEHTKSTNRINIVSTPVSNAGPSFVPFGGSFLIIATDVPDDPLMPDLEDITENQNTGIFGNPYDYEDVEEEVDMNNVASSYTIPNDHSTKFLKDHPQEQVIGNLETPVQTRHMTKINEEHGLISLVYKLRRTNHKDFQNCLFAYYLSQMEPKKPIQALKDPSWVEAMRDELLQFKLLNVWTLVDLPKDKWAIGIDYDEVFAPVARIEAIRLFLAYASFKNFVVYQMDVKSAFLYEKTEEEAPRAWYDTLSTYLLNNGFHKGQIDKTLFIKRHKDDILLVQIYVDDIIFGSTKKEMSTKFEKLMHDKFQISSMGELTFFLGLQVKQKSDGIFISQDKYVAKILKKFDFAFVKTASTLIETNKALVKDEEAEDVDEHLYRSMIGSLMYLTASRPDIMFAVCACVRFQVTPKSSHLHDVKRIFRYLKGQPKLGLWYPRDSPFDLEAFSDSDYAGASIDRKSTTGGCQFLGKRLISWQCKKQTIVANSTTEVEYVAATNCYRHVLWIQNQMLDYGFNFMNTKIYIDNESTICIVKNPVSHSKTKHIEIRHHFIRDSYEKKLIQVIKIHTDQNVVDLLTKAFDVSRFNFLIASIRLLNLESKRGRDTKIPQSGGPPIKVGDEAVHKELDDRMERAAPTASSFVAEQDSGSGPRIFVALFFVEVSLSKTQFLWLVIHHTLLYSEAPTFIHFSWLLSTSSSLTLGIF
ncbi:putative ribonuclease H-like domain-containing protein [Tanacetum coccineum]